MLDCLPASDEWSPRSRYAFLLDHLQAAQQHLSTFESAAKRGLVHAREASEELNELHQRLAEADQLFQQLCALPEAQQKELKEG